jgi:hypothetical protein
MTTSIEELRKTINDTTSLTGAMRKHLQAILTQDQKNGGPDVVGSDFTNAIPTILATVGAALLGASVEKGSILRYAGAVPGVIDLFDKARRTHDAGEVIIPLVTSASGAAAPVLIK